MRRQSATCYAIALVELLPDKGVKLFGSSADKDDCDEIVEINGKSTASNQHKDIVRHIQECIKSRNICLRIKKANVDQIKAKDSQSSASQENNYSYSLLDVFVIGTNANKQLTRFFKGTDLFTHFQESYLEAKMELLELNNQPSENGAYSSQQQIFHQQNNRNNNLAQPHYISQQQQSHSQQQQLQQQGSRYPKMSKHRELPVDVPDSFVGVAKQSPRYPPPKSNRRTPPTAVPNHHNNQASQQHNIPIMPLGTSIVNTQNTLLSNNGTFVSPIMSQTNSQIISSHNSSLRDSIKLKQLEKPKNYHYNNYLAGSMQPAVNKAFEFDEDDIPNHQAQTQAQINEQQQLASQSRDKQTASSKQEAKNNTSYLDSLQTRLNHNLNGEYCTISQDVKLSKLLSIYSTIIQTHSEEFRIPDLTSKHSSEVYTVRDLVRLIYTNCRNDEMTRDAAELLGILSKHEIDGVAATFDRITQSFKFAKVHKSPSPRESLIVTDSTFNAQNFNPYGQGFNQANHMLGYGQIPLDIENNIMYNNNMHSTPNFDVGDMSIETVRIEKETCQPLGATIRKDDTTGSITIARLVCNGTAIKSGLLLEGDEILKINSIPMTNKTTTDEVVDMLKELQGTIEFTIGRRNYARPPERPKQPSIFVKAFFDYHGSKDSYIPCKDLCLNFNRGDILSIVDQSDRNWWQATKDEDNSSLAYLIPSIDLLNEREHLPDDTSNVENTYFKHEKKSPVSILFNCGKSSSLRRRKKSMHMPLSPNEVPFYEEVYTYYPTNFFKRPIILIGPNSIGRREILHKLLQDSDRFASAVSHTSKPMRNRERNGIDFHFVTNDQFEKDIKAGKFVEHGKYEGHHYGTSFDAIKKVVNSKKTCVHLVNAESIINFRQGRAGPELKPFFVFVRPPNQIEKLHNIISTIDQNQHANLQKIIDDAQAIEDNYLPYFDKVLTVTDIEQAYQELLQEIKRIETQPQWIPMFWNYTPQS